MQLYHRIIYKYKGLQGGVVLVVLVESGVTKQQLEALTDYLVKETNVDKICYIDFPELLNAGCSLGFWDTYAGSHLRDKDWSKRPDQTDVDMWSKFMQTETVPLNQPLSPDDAEEKIQALAEQHELGIDEVKRRIEKTSSWIATSA